MKVGNLLPIPVGIVGDGVLLGRVASVGDVDVEGVGEVHGVFLFLDDDGADLFAEGEFAEGFGLADALAVVADGFDFVVEVEAEHVFGFVGNFDGFGGDDGGAAEVIDLFGDDEGVGKFFGGVGFELAGDVHKLSALHGLAVGDVGDDGLVFAGEIFVEEFDEIFAGNGGVFGGGGGLGHEKLLYVKAIYFSVGGEGARGRGKRRGILMGGGSGDGEAGGGGVGVGGGDDDGVAAVGGGSEEAGVGECAGTGEKFPSEGGLGS